MIRYYHFDELESTNEYAEYLVKKFRLKESCVITTDYQTKGQGTKNRIWYAEKNTSLLYSLLLYSEKPSINPKEMVLTAAKIIQKTLQKHFEIRTTIKYPNDIMLNNKKCGGILIKNIIQAKQCWSIIGIGININTRKFPTYLDNIATSIYKETQKNIDIKIISKKLTESLISSYKRILTPSTS